VADYGASVQKETGPNLEAEDRLEHVYRRWQDARDGLNDWRDEAKTCFDFVAGQQWSPDDLTKLEEQERPAVTFNRMGVMVDAVCGLEVNSRQQISYFPREQGDVQISEIETAAAHWVSDQCHGEEEDSEAFRDATICGVGVTEMKMDYESNPDGNIVIERKDPIKSFWDPASVKKCNEDARFVFYADWMDNKEIEDTWPDKYTSVTPWDSLGPDKTPHNADLAFLYKDTDTDFDKHKDQSLVLQYQCFWREQFYRVLDPQTGEIVSIDKEKFAKIRKAYKEATQTDLKFVKQLKRVYYRGFYCGRTELEYKKAECQDGFTFKFITAKRDRNKKMWYGIVRAMMDPQRWANKWLSQILHIINTNAKGGAFVETNAMKDPRKAEEQWAASNPLIELNEGGINKIRERTPAQPPAGLDKLMSFAFESLPYVSGINLESLGLANREQAGVLEAQRRKSAYGILAPLFDALRLYRKLQGRMLLFFIREYISDGRLIKVVGQNGNPKYMPLVRRDDTVEYDLVVDQSPTSPDFREKTWEAMQQILPVMMKEGIPIPPSIFDFAPLPSNVAAEFKQLMQNRGKIPPQVQQKFEEMQQALQQAGQQVQKLTMENSELKVGAQVDILKIHAKHAESADKIASKERQSEMQAFVERANAILKAHVDTVTSHMDRRSDEFKHITQIVSDFRNEIIKARQVSEKDKAPDNNTFVISDTGSGEMSKALAEHTKALSDVAKSVSTRGRRKGTARRQPDGSLAMEIDG
jgi:hypothetical protein